MIYPIVAYGTPILKKVAHDIPNDGSIDVKELSDNMFATMYEASGVGLAGPQVGLGYRIFVIDTEEMEEEGSPLAMKETFINAQMLEESGEEWPFEEGCLSIPGIRETVIRKNKIRIKYYTTDWEEKEIELEGMAARVVQHEYDHIQGVLFTDYLSPLKKTLLKGKLSNISKGKVKHEYRMKFFQGK